MSLMSSATIPEISNHSSSDANFIPVEPSRIVNVNPQAGQGITEAESQQAATAPGAGEIVGETEKVPFKEQVNGYAKIIAGKVFNKPHEVEFGEKKLEGAI